MVTIRGKKINLNSGVLGSAVFLKDVKQFLLSLTSAGFMICVVSTILLLTLHTEGTITVMMDNIFKENPTNAFYMFMKKWLHNILALFILSPLYFIIKLSEIPGIALSVVVIVFVLPNATYLTYAIEMLAVLIVIKIRHPLVRIGVFMLVFILLLLNVIHHSGSNTLHTQSNETNAFFLKYERTCASGYEWDNVYHRCDKKPPQCTSAQYYSVTGKICKDKPTCSTGKTFDSATETCK